MALYRSVVCGHSGFSVSYDGGGKKVVDKTATVCMQCATYFVDASSNTSNMSGHLWRHHPNVSIDTERRRESGWKEQLSHPAAFRQTCLDCFCFDLKHRKISSAWASLYVDGI